MIDDLRRLRDDAMRVDIDGLDALAGDHNLPAPDIVRMRMPARAPFRARAGPGADRRGELAIGEHDPAVMVAGAHFGPSPSAPGPSGRGGAYTGREANAYCRSRASASGSRRVSRAAHSSCPAGSAIKSWRISISTCGRPRISPWVGTV